MPSDDNANMEPDPEAAEDAQEAGKEEPTNAASDEAFEAHIWRAQS